MKKVGKKNIIICVIAIIAVVLIVVGYQKWKEVRTARLEEQLEQIETRNKYYTRVLYIKGDFSYEPERVIVNDMSIYEPYTFANVMLYNEFTEGEEITMEQALEEYDTFCNTGLSGGLEQYEGLEALIDMDFPESVHYITRDGYNKNLYEEYIYNYLNQNFDELDPSLEQMEKAASYALVRINNELYTGILGIGGEFTYEPNKVSVQDMNVDYVWLISYIALYNQYCTDDEQVTVDQVLNEYETFCKSGEKSRMLDTVIKFTTVMRYRIANRRWSYDTYKTYYADYISDRYGVELEDATKEQLLPAAEYAAKRFLANRIGIEGDFTYQSGRVTLQRTYVDYTKLIPYVAIYNEFSEDSDVTVDEVVREFEDLCNGEGNALDKVIRFDYDSPYDVIWTFNRYLDDALKAIGVDDPSEATHEQLQEAAERVAKTIHMEMGK